MDKLTKSWIRNPSDKKAAGNGCKFDVMEGLYVVWWIERHCKLYEGEYAGQPMILRGCGQCEQDYIIGEDWDDPETQRIYRERAEKHNACYHAGHFLDWQFECTIRLFGWMRWSDRWQRHIRRFREAVIFAGKKQKKSPSVASWALYLLCGDGEPGQNVFLGAKDGMQAREIAGNHARIMVEQSPELSAECQINKSTMQITHLPSRSRLRPLSSSNTRTQESKEGLNGSVVIDECHVVDRAFVNRISRAGISRSEPLQIEVSTAGNNPDSYGKERFDYALEVMEGKRDDDRLFAAVYAAPQDVTDAELAKDILKYARMANPSLGHTVDAGELQADYERSKDSILRFADFKMYRLNIWQRSANPWIRSSDWARCKGPIPDAVLHGLQCWAGLDLSKTQDMTALVLFFDLEDDEQYYIKPFFWLPEETARENEHLAPFLTWGRAGFIQLTPGNVVDYGFIKKTIRDVAGQFRIQKLAYDPHYAEEITQQVCEGEMGEGGQVLHEGIGVERIAFGQTLMNFTGPCKEFERLILAGKMLHGGHPVMDWQIGHVTVKSDANDNIRPLKPKKGDVKKIDGVIAAVQALGVCLADRMEGGPSVYEEAGQLAM